MVPDKLSERTKNPAYAGLCYPGGLLFSHHRPLSSSGSRRGEGNPSSCRHSCCCVFWLIATHYIVDSKPNSSQDTQKDVDAKSLRNKSWPFYEDRLIIFGKDRAIGEFAESAADAVENMDKEDEVGESVPLDNSGVSGMECSNSVTHHPTVSSEKKKEKKRARAADTLVDGLANFADKLCHVMEKADSRMEFIGSRMG
ncbi:hypothetical protein Acr_20g0006130 [Actinidia rufa]|uniref:Uncharacterized protein n=1 Tax=Actinidia rufa TaxID=165716 RepID=A0A7J0GDA8_9ERIC|nr:hypothetical protein Acr_20g0006130 [Actinidia rufa]